MTTDKFYMLRLEAGFGDEFYFFHSKAKAKQRLWEYYEAHYNNEPEEMRKAAEDQFDRYDYIEDVGSVYEYIFED